MRTKTILLVILLCAGAFSCDEENNVVDPIYEFIAFAGEFLGQSKRI